MELDPPHSALKVQYTLGRLHSNVGRIGGGDLGHRIAVQTGDELEDFWDALNPVALQRAQRFHAAAGNGLLQEFRQDLGQRNLTSDRFCALGPTAVTVNSTLKFASSRNGVRWVVAAWPRAKLPRFQVLCSVILTRDHLDPDNWFSLWTRPIPGTIVY